MGVSTPSHIFFHAGDVCASANFFRDMIPVAWGLHYPLESDLRAFWGSDSLTIHHHLGWPRRVGRYKLPREYGKMYCRIKSFNQKTPTSLGEMWTILSREAARWVFFWWCCMKVKTNPAGTSPLQDRTHIWYIANKVLKIPKSTHIQIQKSQIAFLRHAKHSMYQNSDKNCHLFQVFTINMPVDYIGFSPSF